MLLSHSTMDVELESAKSALLDTARYADRELKPLARAVDRDGLYPEAFLRGLGRLHGYGGAGESERPSVDLSHQLKVIEAVGQRCGATAFSVWCQSACAWYLQCSPNAAPRRRYLGDVLSGTLLAGTGMSNTLKHLSELEDMRLHARVEGDGSYVVDGALPWISNLGSGHLLLTAAAVEGGGYAMFAIRTDAPGIRIKACPQFSGMMGVGTYSVRFRSAIVTAEDVLASPDQFESFVALIKPGMILSQVGIGLGIIKGCVDIVKAIHARSRTNRFLEDGEAEIHEDLAVMEEEAQSLARDVHAGDVSLLSVLRLRARISERTLRIAESTLLRCGARGYLAAHPVQRRLREAIFVAIFTPALKHLRKEIHELRELETSVACAG